MLDQHSLWPAGRPGCVDHVRQVLGRDRRGRVCRAERRQLDGISVETDRRHLDVAEALEQPLICDDQAGARVGEDEIEPLPRVLGVERQIRRAGLEHAEDPGDEVERGLEEERDKGLRPGAELDQPVRDPVGALVELPVAERLSLELHRDSVRRGVGASLKRLVHALHRVFAAALAAGREHLLAFVCVEQRQLVDRSPRVGERTLEKSHIPAGKPLDRDGIE